MRSTGGGGGPAKTRAGREAARRVHAKANEKEIERHIRHYAENPRAHARALRDLGLSGQQRRLVHQSALGLSPKYGAKRPIKPAKGKVAGLIGLGAKIGEDISNAAIYSPVGAYRVGEAGYHDIGDTIHGKPTLKRTGGIAKLIARGTYEDIRHPGRHPGNLLLDVAAGVGAVEGAAARVGAASRAIKAGEGVGRAATRKSYEGGSLLHRPNTGRVEHRVKGDEGELVVKTPASKRAGVAALQRRRAEKRSAGPDAERHARKALTKERRIAEAVERAPMEALAAKSKRLSTPQQTALRVYNEGKPIHERVTFHEKQRDKAGRGTAGRVRHNQKILLLKTAERYVEHDEKGTPRLKPIESATSKKERVQLEHLHDTQALLGRVAKTREERYAAIGKLGDDRIEARLHGPGRVIQGARYERTPAKKARKEHVREYPTAPREVTRLGVISGRSRTIERPRTRAEAEKFVADVDKDYENLVKRLAEAEVKPKDITVKRNNRRAKLEKRGAESRAKPTLMAEARQHAEKIIRESDHPIMVAMRERLAEVDPIREELARTEPDPIFGNEEAGATADLGTVTEKTPGGKPSLGLVTETIPGKPRRVRMRERKAERAKSGLVGADLFQGGRTRIPYTATEAPRSHGRAQQWQGGLPRDPGSLTHEFKGGLLLSGNFRDESARLVAESGLEAQRHTAVLRLRDRVMQATRETPREGDIAIRTEALKNKPFPSNVQAVMRKREEGVKLTRDEAQLLRDELEKLREDVFPQIDPLDHAKHKDVRWINPELLDGAQRQAFRLSNAIGDRPVEVIDAINNASKLAILYLKPAYAVPNIAGNAFLNVVQQGLLAPANWARSGFIYKRLGDEAAATLDSVMGEGIARSISHSEGVGQKAVAGAAAAWSTAVDLIFRRAAFIHEARRLGYKGPADLRKLLTDEAHRDDLLEAAQRAKDAIIDYENLGQREREIVRRMIFFYPWVKGSTMYAGHFLAEHPIQAGATGALGEYGKEHTGLPSPGPSYLQGSFKAGGRLVNPAAAAVFQTPAQVYQALHALEHGKVTEAARLGSFATPALDLAISEIARTDSFGRPIPASESGLDVAKKSLVESLPQVTLIERLRRAGKPDEKDRLFPIEKPSDALMPFVAGGPYPRRYNEEQYLKQGMREQRGLRGRRENAIIDYQRSTDDLKAAFRKVGEKGIPKDVAGRLMLKRERHLNRLKVGGGHDMTSAEAFGADVDLIVRHGWMKPDEAKRAKAWADKAPKDDVSTALRYLTVHYFDPDHLLSESVKYLREHGSPDVKVPTLP